MASFLEDHGRLFRLFSVLHFVGRSFLKICEFTSVVKPYVCGVKEEVVGGKRKRLDGDEMFVREAESLFYLFPELGDVKRFQDFHDSSVSCAQPMGTVLVSKLERCRFCKKLLAVDPNRHVVVMSLLIARVKFEPESSSSHESASSSQGPFQVFFLNSFFFYFFGFILISLIVILAFIMPGIMMCRLPFDTLYTKFDIIFPVNAIATIHSQQRPKANKEFPEPLK